MALQKTDEFYIQRQLTSSTFERYKASIEQVSDLIQIDTDQGVQDVNDRLDKEIIDRTDGDQDLNDRISGLSNRIEDVSKEVFDIILTTYYDFDYNAQAHVNYLTGLSQCNGLLGDNLEQCLSTRRGLFHEEIAHSPDSKTDGHFYLCSTNNTYEETNALFISAKALDGTLTDFRDITDIGNYIKVIETTTDPNGTEIVNDFNYAFYQIVDNDFEPATESNTQTDFYRLDVRYVGHCSDNPGEGPSLTNNKFKLMVMIDSVTGLSESFVKKAGDTMTGPLVIDPEDPGTGLKVKAPGEIDSLAIPNEGKAGYDLEFSNADTTNIRFDTQDEVRVTVNSSLIIEDQGSGTIFNYSKDNDIFAVSPTTEFAKKALYTGVFNIEASDTTLLTPKFYVDLQDDNIRVELDDINNRIDTLASVIDTLQYTYQDTNACDQDVAPGDNNYPTEGKDWIECIKPAIQAYNFALYGFNEDYVDSDGPNNRDVDVIVLHQQAKNVANGADIIMNWDNSINPGDFLEISQADARQMAYAIYRVVTTENRSERIIDCQDDFTVKCWHVDTNWCVHCQDL